MARDATPMVSPEPPRASLTLASPPAKETKERKQTGLDPFALAGAEAGEDSPPAHPRRGSAVSSKISVLRETYWRWGSVWGNCSASKTTEKRCPTIRRMTRFRARRG